MSAKTVGDLYQCLKAATTLTETPTKGSKRTLKTPEKESPSWIKSKSVRIYPPPAAKKLSTEASPTKSLKSLSFCRENSTLSTSLQWHDEMLSRLNVDNPPNHGVKIINFNSLVILIRREMWLWEVIQVIQKYYWIKKRTQQKDKCVLSTPPTVYNQLFEFLKALIFLLQVRDFLRLRFYQSGFPWHELVIEIQLKYQAFFKTSWNYCSQISSWYQCINCFFAHYAIHATFQDEIITEELSQERNRNSSQVPQFSSHTRGRKTIYRSTVYWQTSIWKFRTAPITDSVHKRTAFLEQTMTSSRRIFPSPPPPLLPLF